MNKEQTVEMKERLKAFENKWVAKKSRLPFGSGDGKQKPAFYQRKISHDKRHNSFFFRNGKAFRVLLNEIDNYEVVSKEEALKLNKMFHESKVVSECKESLDNVCIRMDTGMPKMKFPPNGFQRALYTLKLKCPDKICSAYVCPVCKSIHIGKLEKTDHEN